MPKQENTSFLGIDLNEAIRFIKNYKNQTSKSNLLLEFKRESISYAEASCIGSKVLYSKVNNIKLDSSAIEKGSPADPQEMANFISQILEEDQIYTHKVSVVLPPESAFNKIIYVPEELTLDQSRDFIVNSESGFQFPIPIQQTEYDIIPIYRRIRVNGVKKRGYLLSSIPKKLIDNLVNCFEMADLELDQIQLASSCLSRFSLYKVADQKINQFTILLDLDRDCTNFILVNKIGINFIKRLAAIRDYSEEIAKKEQSNSSVLNSNINQTDTLPLTDLDLKVLISEIKSSKQEIIDLFPNCEIKSILITGPNCAHSGAEELIQKHLNLPTSSLESFSDKRIADISFNKIIHKHDISRLLGIGLSMLDKQLYSNEHSYDELPDYLYDKSVDIQDKFVNNSINSKEYIGEIDKNQTREVSKISNFDDNLLDGEPRYPKTNTSDIEDKNNDLILKDQDFFSLDTQSSNSLHEIDLGNDSSVIGLDQKTKSLNNLNIKDKRAQSNELELESEPEKESSQSKGLNQKMRANIRTDVYNNIQNQEEFSMDDLD